MHFYHDWAKQILLGATNQHLAFYGLPGYAYLLAATYKVFGENPFVPGLLQALLDAGTALLIYRISILIFAPTAPTSQPSKSGIHADARLVGAIGGFGWALFVPAQAYSVVLMPTAWFVFVFWFVVWRLVRTNATPKAGECFFLAALVGLTAMAVATVLAVVPLMIAALLLKPRAIITGRSLFAKTGPIVAGLALGTSPCWIHNYFVAKDPVILSAHSGINFWIGNNPEANGYPRFPPGLRAGQAAMLQDSIDQAEAASARSLKRGEISRYWSDKAKHFIATQFGDWLELLGLKLRNFWNAFQYDDLSIITILREQGVIFPGLYFGVIAALAVPGIFVAARIAPTSRWILAAVLLSMSALLAVFITERYRLVAVPGLLIFAGFGLSVLWQRIAAGELGSAAVYLAILASSTVLVAAPPHDPSLWALDAYNAGWQALESNNLDLAERKLGMAYAYVPTNAETRFALGNLRLAEGKSAAAMSFYRAALSVNPRHKGALNNLGVIALNNNSYNEAENWFANAEQVDPNDAKTHYLLARTFEAKGERDRARAEIDIAIRLKPDQPEFAQLDQQIGRPSSGSSR